MEFDKKLAASLLHLIALQSPEGLLRSSRVLPALQFGDMCSTCVPKAALPENVLGHLFVLVQSDLIRPVSPSALSLESLKGWMSKVPPELSESHSQNQRTPHGYMCYDVLPELLPQCFLTVQGYKFLANNSCQTERPAFCLM